jgi:hypothetical protein
MNQKSSQIKCSFPTTSVLTATTFVYTFRCWSYRGCWHQSLPSNCYSIRDLLLFSFSLQTQYFQKVISLVSLICCHYLPVYRIGEFTRLLLSLDIVAISHAPSPVSNPNCPLPVITMVVPYTTIQS